MTKRKPAPSNSTAGPAPAVASPPPPAADTNGVPEPEPAAETAPEPEREPAAAPSDAPEQEPAAGTGEVPEPHAEQPLEPGLSGMLAVRSVASRGRWRIGRHFTQEVTEIDVATLSEDELAALAGDPELICAMSD